MTSHPWKRAKITHPSVCNLCHVRFCSLPSFMSYFSLLPSTYSPPTTGASWDFPKLSSQSICQAARYLPQIVTPLDLSQLPPSQCDSSGEHYLECLNACCSISLDLITLKYNTHIIYFVFCVSPIDYYCNEDKVLSFSCLE